jgi:nitrite reductase (NADH) large subunit
VILMAFLETAKPVAHAELDGPLTDVLAPAERDPVIVIGGGPCGIRVAQELARRQIPAVLFNAERWQPYNRVKLTPFLAGDIQLGQIYHPLTFAHGSDVAVYSGHSIIDIDRAAKTVTGRYGRSWRYDKLVICVGSRPHIPPIPGREKPGVYTFRNLDDTERLMARSFRARKVVVIGGGLLGLEAARGFARRGAHITVVEHESHLMARQLDLTGGQLLGRQIEAMGMTVRTGMSVKEIDGDGSVEGVILGNGERIACDSVVICTGIRANSNMALDAGLAVGRGIKVNAQMRTNDPDIYAVGECAEFEGHIFGLVGPGLEQAEIAVADIAGDAASYSGSVPATRLKVVGVDIFSLGDVEQVGQRTDIETVTYEKPDQGVYTLLATRRGQLVGALGVGPCDQVNRIQQAVKERRRIWPWQLRRFRSEGRLWSDETPSSVIEWPAAATVCNCTGVTRSRIGDAIALGCRTYAEVKRDTGASTVCGTCRPLIEQLLTGKPVDHNPVGWFRAILFLSALTLIAALATVFLPAWPYSQSVETASGFDELWRDGYWKQVSGFVLLGLCALAAFLSLRKRVRWLSFGGFEGWRLVHVAVGSAAILALFVHTGFRLGENFNSWLMIAFLAAAGLGALSGGIMAVEHRLMNGPMRGTTKPPRRVPIWLHILAFWPLPVLLALHILTVYYY